MTSTILLSIGLFISSFICVIIEIRDFDKPEEYKRFFWNLIYVSATLLLGLIASVTWLGVSEELGHQNKCHFSSKLR